MTVLLSSLQAVLAHLHLRGFLTGSLAGAVSAGDEAAAAAIAAYQRFHGLEETGTLTPELARSLLAPRFCALPDVLPASESLARWPGPRIRWHLRNPDGFGGLTGAKVREAFTWAWAQWAAVCGIEPEETFDPTAAQVQIECERIDRPGQVLAWSELADGTDGAKRQRYDSAESWVWVQGAGVPGARIDLGRVAAHEIGHVLGIPHIASGNLLQPLYDLRIDRPQAGDIAEARARYGPPRTTPAPTPPGPVPGSGITITIDGDVRGIVIPGFRVTRVA